MGETCWYPCDKKEGACGFCGLDGVCCRKGYTGNGCDGKIGGDDEHRCASKPGTLAVKKPELCSMHNLFIGALQMFPS
jgi:hypothetical protein